jgi:hydroxymethylpyrimidine/phosphomethylpyrimidine kinase
MYTKNFPGDCGSELPAEKLPPIDSILSDIGADAVKTGMLANGEIIEVVVRRLSSTKWKK